jgi:spore germination cell wall hydrolase CwlJ-like protein
MKKLFRTVAVTVNLATLIGMIAFGVFHYSEAQAEQAILNLGEEEVLCLRQNIYFEAGNQSALGKRAVAWVTLNRVVDDRYPNSICGVVKQGKKNSDGSMKRHACQFSWYCDGKTDTVPNTHLEQAQWSKSELIARSVLRQWFLDYIDPTEGADHYHADYVAPDWAAAGEQTVQIDRHLFYRVSW